MTPANTLITQAAELAKAFDENFLELAATLRQLHEIGLQEFRRGFAEAGLGERKAYCLLAIARKFGSLEISKLRLRELGWTKLSLLTRYVDETNWEELLELAEQHTAAALKAVLRNEDPAGKAHAMVLHFSKFDRDMLEGIMLSFGASQVPGGMVNREDALLAMAEWAYEELQKLPVEGAPDEDWDEDDENNEIDFDEASLDVVANAMIELLAKKAAQQDHLALEKNAADPLNDNDNGPGENEGK